MPLRLVFAMAGLLAAAGRASAQRPGALVTVRGIAYDSIRRAPLRDALVTLGGGARTTTTDSRGRFHFDSVAPGAYTVGILHPTLDSLGFTGFARRAKVTDGVDEMRIATPSFATLWRVACGRAPAREDSGFVYGTVRSALTHAPVAGAVIDVTWIDLVAAKRRLTQQTWSGETRSDSSGNYALCGVPFDAGLRVHAARDSATSGYVDLPFPPRDSRVQRRDLFVSVPLGMDSTRFGAITGLLTDAAGAPFAEARVVVDGMPETRSGTDGRFFLRDVAPGTRQVTFLHVGMDPMTTIVDVMARDTARVEMQLGKVAHLDAVHTTGAHGVRLLAAEFDERRKVGFGHMMDSTMIAKHDQFVNALREIPGLRVHYRSGALDLSVADGRGGECAPEVRIDGAPAAFGHLVDLFPREVAGLEVYPRAGVVPIKFTLNGVRPLCGMVLVWTKYGFANR